MTTIIIIVTTQPDHWVDPTRIKVCHDQTRGLIQHAFDTKLCGKCVSMTTIIIKVTTQPDHWVDPTRIKVSDDQTRGLVQHTFDSKL